MFKNIYSKYFYESEIKKALMPFYLVLVTVFVVLAVFAVKIVDNSTKKNTISESLGFIE